MVFIHDLLLNSISLKGENHILVVVVVVYFSGYCRLVNSKNTHEVKLSNFRQLKSLFKTVLHVGYPQKLRGRGQIPKGI